MERKTGAQQKRPATRQAQQIQVKKTDPRPAQDKAFITSCIKKIIDYLVRNNYTRPVSLAMLQTANIQEFWNIIQFLLRYFSQSIQISNDQTKLSNWIKALGYPFAITKQAFQGNQSQWYSLILLIAWIVDLVKFLDSQINEYDNIAQCSFDAYQMFLEGCQDNEIWQTLSEEYSQGVNDLENDNQNLQLSLNELENQRIELQNSIDSSYKDELVQIEKEVSNKMMQIGRLEADRDTKHAETLKLLSVVKHKYNFKEFPEDFLAYFESVQKENNLVLKKKQENLDNLLLEVEEKEQILQSRNLEISQTDTDFDFNESQFYDKSDNNHANISFSNLLKECNSPDQTPITSNQTPSTHLCEADLETLENDNKLLQQNIIDLQDQVNQLSMQIKEIRSNYKTYEDEVSMLIISDGQALTRHSSTLISWIEELSSNQFKMADWSSQLMSLYSGNQKIQELAIKPQSLNDINSGTTSLNYSSLTYDDSLYVKMCMEALLEGDLKMIKEAIQKEIISINQLDTEGYAVIHIAAWKRGFDIVKLILDELDCPLDLQSGQGFTPLNVSASRGDLKTMKLLLDRGADIEKQDFKGRTPLLSCFKHGQINAALLLIYRGANIQARSNNGKGPFHYCGKYNHTDMLWLASALGIDWNEQDSKGNQPFKLALKNNSGKFVQDYLQRNGFPRKLGFSGALSIAQRNGARSSSQAVINQFFDSSMQKGRFWWCWQLIAIIFFAIYCDSLIRRSGQYLLLSTVYIVSFLIQICCFFILRYSKPGYLIKNQDWENFLCQIGEYLENFDDGSKKYCYTCLNLRPQRSKHCKYCNQCVSNYQTHSLFIGKCIGKDNFGLYFLWFLTY